jgi:hypothetical protein
MHIRIFTAAAMPYVHTELKHLKAVCQNIFPEFRIDLPVFFSFSGQVKHYEYPHNAVSI